MFLAAATFMFLFQARFRTTLSSAKSRLEEELERESVPERRRSPNPGPYYPSYTYVVRESPKGSGKCSMVRNCPPTTLRAAARGITRPEHSTPNNIANRIKQLEVYPDLNAKHPSVEKTLYQEAKMRSKHQNSLNSLNKGSGANKPLKK